jgi:hypothetical protein
MVSPHLWPRSVKRVVLFLGVLVVLIAYTTLCSGLFALAMLFT